MFDVTLLPPNETETMMHKDLAYRSVIEDHTEVIDYDPHTCVAPMLPHLAYAFDMPYWDTEWKTDVKRALMAEARELHRHAGTPWCLLRILEIMGLSIPGTDKEAIIIEYGNRDRYRYQVKRDGTKRYDGSHKHNGNALIYEFGFGHWSEFGVVIKVPAGRNYIKYAIRILERFKPTHTKLIGIWYDELPTRDGVRYKYNGEHTHGGSVIRNGRELVITQEGV